MEQESFSNQPEDLYAQRTKLIHEAFNDGQTASGESAPLQLKSLLSIMKQKSMNNPAMASLYFAGAEGDHPFFLQGNSIALGISVLPEDKKKAGQWKRHPHQEEGIFVLDGSLHLQLKEDDGIITKKLSTGDCYLISKNLCHRIIPEKSEHGAYLFVKTHPVDEPRAETC